MNPNKPISLKGKNAKKFTEYQNRKGTLEEIAYFKKSEEYYHKHS